MWELLSDESCDHSALFQSSPLPVFDLVKTTQVLIGSMYKRQVKYEKVNVPTNLCQCSKHSLSHFPLFFLPCQHCGLLVDLFMVLIIYQF
jgi:hypothetical protein